MCHLYINAFFLCSLLGRLVKSTRDAIKDCTWVFSFPRTDFLLGGTSPMFLVLVFLAFSLYAVFHRWSWTSARWDSVDVAGGVVVAGLRFSGFSVSVSDNESDAALGSVSAVKSTDSTSLSGLVCWFNWALWGALTDGCAACGWRQIAHYVGVRPCKNPSQSHS